MGGRKINPANTNQKRAKVAVFQTDQISRQEKLSGIRKGIHDGKEVNSPRKHSRP